MICANALWPLISAEDFGGFAEKVHYGLENALEKKSIMDKLSR